MHPLKSHKTLQSHAASHSFLITIVKQVRCGFMRMLHVKDDEGKTTLKFGSRNVSYFPLPIRQHHEDWDGTMGNIRSLHEKSSSYQADLCLRYPIKGKRKRAETTATFAWFAGCF